MPILALIAVLLLALLILGPQVWVRRALARHSADRPDLGGTGAELARHLLDLADLKEVRVEETESGDHYDPTARVVRLSKDHHSGRTVTALAVAAHEVGHALQHRDKHPLFVLRTRLAAPAAQLERMASFALILAPIAAIGLRSLTLFFIQIALVAVLLLVRVALHVITLPVELDASWRRALPILKTGGFLEDSDLPAARSVLRAAAFTYVAAALATLLDVARLARALRF